MTHEQRISIYESVSDNSDAMYKRLKNLSKIEDNEKLEDRLIKYAEKSRFKDSHFSRWSETYSDKSPEKIKLK